MTQLFHRLHVAWLKSQIYFQRARNIWFRWQCYRLYRQNQRRWLRDQDQRAKIKGRIIRVGEFTVQVKPNPFGLGFVAVGDSKPKDWEVDCSNGALPRWLDENGKVFYWGYSLQELNEIAQAPAEWVDVQN